MIRYFIIVFLFFGLSPFSQALVESKKQSLFMPANQLILYSKLKSAILNRDIKAIQNLLDRGVDINRAYNNLNALMLASYQGSLDIVKLLVYRGAHVNAVNSTGETALIKSVRFGYLDIAEFLIKKGADINTTTALGETALSQASYGGYPAIVKLLIQNGAEINGSSAYVKGRKNVVPIISASSAGHIDVVRLLIESGADINAQDKNGWTALMRAVYWKQEDIAKLLIEKKADLSIKNDWGETALKYALFYKQQSIIDQLKQASATE